MHGRIFRTGVLSIVLAALAPSAAYAAGVSPSKATPVQREQAQRRFLKGRELYNAKKYDAALEELNASLDIVASPNTRLYIGRCLRDMGRLVPAYVELGRAAIEAKELVEDDSRYESTAAAAEDERARLEPKLGFVEVTVTRAGPETTLRVAGDEVRRGGWAEPVPVAPGSIAVVVETPGKGTVEQTVQVAAGEHKTVTIDADAEARPQVEAQASVAPPEAGAPRDIATPLAYATAGVAAAGLATFLVAGAMSNGTYSDLEEACGTGPCPPGYEGEISTGKTQQAIANVGLAVFAVAAAASVTLFVISASKKPVAAALDVGPSFFTMRGTF
jgi:tetratricopeptide (TPR) repeat protein